MSKQYDVFLKNHKANVKRGLEWIRKNLPELLDDDFDYELQIMEHDQSKTTPAEYDAYDKYHYGGNRSYSVVQDYRLAWLVHIHRNPHHWQYWVLINDDPGEGEIILDMPQNYIIEMICDWWSFSWSKGDLNEIFKWYDEHKAHMKLSANTKKTVEDILRKIEDKLGEETDT